MERKTVFYPNQAANSWAMFTQGSDEQTQPLGPRFLLQEGFQEAERSVGASPWWGVTQGCSVMTNCEDLHASLPQAIQKFDNRWACNYSPFERFLMHWFESHWFFFLVRRTTKRSENTSTSQWFLLWIGFSQHILQAKWKHSAPASQTVNVIEWSNCLPVRSWAEACFLWASKMFELNASQSLKKKEKRKSPCCMWS